MTELPLWLKNLFILFLEQQFRCQEPLMHITTGYLMVSKKNKIAQELNLWRFLTVICRRFSIERLNRRKNRNFTPSDNNRYHSELFLRSLKLCDSSNLADMAFSIPFFSVTKIHNKSSHKIFGSSCPIL